MKPEARLAKVLGACEKAFGTRRNKTKLPPLETAIIAALAPGSTDEAAASAIEDLKKEFVDWNEVRVSSWKEIGYTLEARKIAIPGEKAFILKKLLEAVFSRMNKMSLDALAGVKPEEARKTLEQMTDLPDYAASAVWSLSLDQDSMFITPSILRAAARIGFVPENNPPKIRKYLEEQVQKKDRFLLQQHLGYIASSVCLATSPLCAGCPLSEQACDTGIARVAREQEMARETAAREVEKVRKAAVVEKKAATAKAGAEAAASKAAAKSAAVAAKQAEKTLHDGDSARKTAAKKTAKPAASGHDGKAASAKKQAAADKKIDKPAEDAPGSEKP